MKRHLPSVFVALIAVAIGVVVLRERAIAPTTDRHPASGAIARNLILITIDTLRADHVGAYGYAANTTPSLDRIAAAGVRFEHVYAPAPITLASHASMLTGRYPPGHGARDNGMRMTAGVPTLATVLHERGFQTAAFIAAFPLDRRFGLSPGFDVYSDRMPRGPGGKLLNERSGEEVVNEAISWLSGRRKTAPFFLWVHLFEPHAPYGDPAREAGHTPIERYDEEIRTADAQVGRLLDTVGSARADTLVVAVGDHGEAFGEHGEVTHSLFVYDTTLRVPWLMSGPGIRPTAAVTDPVCLVDLAPTVLAMLGVGKVDADGIDVQPALRGQRLPAREFYAESFAPLFDFGWSPLRSIRRGGWKAIAAPRPELYDLDGDPGETSDLSANRTAMLQLLVDRADKYSPADIRSQATTLAAADREAAARLRALGYIQGAQGSGLKAQGNRPDPKDRRELAARMGMVVAGELRGAALKEALEAILRDDPRNPQAHLRLGDCLVDEGLFAAAAPHFAAAIAADLPSVDGYVGLAACQVASGKPAAAEQTLHKALESEPGNPVVLGNLGILQAKAGRLQQAIASLARAVEEDPDLHQARFNLALAYADSGRRENAEREARELLARLPATSPQRSEVERLLGALKR